MYDINMAYNEILVYDTSGNVLYPNSNVADYDIHPSFSIDCFRLKNLEEKYGITFPYVKNEATPEKLESQFFKFNTQKIDEILDNTIQNFNSYLLEDIYLTDKEFIYPIVLYNDELFTKYETIELKEKLIECVKNKRARICFIQITEGFFGYSDQEYLWLAKLSEKYGLEKDDIIVITANMNAPDYYEKLCKTGFIKDSLVIYAYPYFQKKLWFHGNNTLNETIRKDIFWEFEYHLKRNRTELKPYHFLCFNRVTKMHRVALVAELLTNKKLLGKSILSMRRFDKEHKLGFFNLMNRQLPENYKHDKKKIVDFYEKYDATQHFIYDESDLENNKASVLNRNAHSISFVNIVTESLTSERLIFFSEKTSKPICCCQPFIIFGNPNSLKNLKKQGYKTFDKWWDESYDEEINVTKRLEKIVDVLEEIASWDTKKCFQITQEMEEILVHNFDVMMNPKETLELYLFLHSRNKTINYFNTIKKII